MILRIRRFSSILFIASLGFLAGCFPAEAITLTATVTSGSHAFLPSPRNPTSTWTVTGDRISATPTGTREDQGFSSTETPYPSPTITPWPTYIPTPTRGLPPTITLSPKEECPPPTHAKVEITFDRDVGYGQQILKYYRANGDRGDLQQQLENAGGEVPNIVEFTEVDVTGDQVKETIITLKQASVMGWSGTFDMDIYVIGCRDGQYRLFGNSDMFLIGGEEQYSRIEDIQDLNGNGLLEIILVSGNTFSQQADVFFTYRVVEWGGTRFRTLLNEELVSNTGFPLEFQDVDGNGTMELLFSEPFNIHCGIMPGWGPQRDAKNIFMWNGAQYQYIWRDPGTPKFRFQAAFDGDYFTLRELYDRAEKRYRKAIDDSSLKPFTYKNYRACYNPQDFDSDESEKILVYARFRLLELDVFLGKMDDAKSMWQHLTSLYEASAPGYNFVSLAKVFWEAYQARADIGEACIAVQLYAEKNEPPDFGLMNYGEFNPGPTPETICPFHSSSG